MRGDPRRVYWSPHHSHDPASFTAGELLSAMQSRRHSRFRNQRAICIIENIKSDWVDKIGDAMKLDANFFVHHFNEHWDNEPNPWHWAVEPDQPKQPQLEEEARQWRSVEGSFSLPRQLRSEPVKTRISYYRAEKLCRYEL
jgi:hypothetical protein